MLAKRCPFCGHKMTVEELCLNTKCPDYQKRTVSVFEMVQDKIDKGEADDMLPKGESV